MMKDYNTSTYDGYNKCRSDRKKHIDAFKQFIEYSDNGSVEIPKKLAEELLDIMQNPLPIMSGEGRGIW